MQIADLGGLTKNNHEKTKEFAIHFPETYDYRFKVSEEKRNQVIQVLQKQFSEIKNQNLPIFVV